MTAPRMLVLLVRLVTNVLWIPDLLALKNALWIPGCQDPFLRKDLSVPVQTIVTLGIVNPVLLVMTGVLFLHQSMIVGLLPRPTALSDQVRISIHYVPP